MVPTHSLSSHDVCRSKFSFSPKDDTQRLRLFYSKTLYDSDTVRWLILIVTSRVFYFCKHKKGIVLYVAQSAVVEE